MKRTFTLAPLACLLLLLFVCNAAFSQIKPQTMLQIKLLGDEKKSRTPVERKISSQLLQAVRESQGKHLVEGVPLKPAHVRADAAGNLLVDINAVVTKALVARITALGGTIVFSSPKFHAIRAKVNLSAVHTISGYAEVKFIRPASRPRTVGGINANTPSTGGLANTVNPTKGFQHTPFKQRAEKVKQQLQKYLMVLGTGSVDSQGDHTLGADSARAKYGYMGQGIRIGVLSDSYNSNGGEAADIANGDLPGPGNPLGNTTPVTVLEDIIGGTDEGRAMLQIVHDIAPKAQLFFATAYSSDADFANNILLLRSAPNNCDIIIDDVAYPDEPVFQDGIVAQAVNEVTANGAMYFSSAANGGSKLFNFSSVWQGDFNDAGSPSFQDGGTVHNFGSLAAPEIGDSLITSTISSEYQYIGGATYSMNWADPLGGSSNDYDLFLVDVSGNVIGSSTNPQDGKEDPYEEIDYGNAPNQGDQLVVFKSTAAQKRAFSINANLDGEGKGFKYTTTGGTHGHSSAVAAFSVAAADASKVYPGLFSAASPVEYFSSDGLRQMFFNADSTAITPGNFLFGTNGGAVRQKPDITGTDGVTTAVNGTGTSFAPFYGTSAAAPHVGAIAALLKSANPSLTPTQIRNLLTSTALDIEAPGYDNNSGWGIVQAFAAMQKLNPTPLPVLSLGQVNIAEGSFSNHNGILDPGETGTVVVQLLNKSLATDSVTSAVLSTSTPGVTITQGTGAFGNIVPGGNASNTGTAFTFAVNSSVPCGTVITFYISAYLGGRAVSPQGFAFSTVVGTGTFTISSQLGATPPTATGYTSTSGQQTGRLSRGSFGSTCLTPLPADTLLYKTGLRQYDAYTFTNTSTSAQCISITVTSANGANIYTAVYNNAGFVPTNPAANFIGNPGQSSNSMQYSFSAPAGNKYTIVVDDVNGLPASQTAYTLTVSFNYCSAAPTCTPVKITTNSIASGATGSHYNQVFTASGGSGSYLFSLTGNLPAGISFGGDSLFGKPTQAGSFPVVVTATDPAGCPAGSQNDTLIIAGIPPASVTAVAGTPQTAVIGNLFANGLQAKVFDAGKKALGGVNVIFTAPASGASGTFANGTDTATIVTDSTGVAAAPAFTADTTVGAYTVTASVTGLTTPANFLLNNVCGPTLVTSSADSGPGSLRDIIANACPGSTITFAPGINYITLTSGQIALSQAVSINGPGAGLLTVDGGQNDRIFQVQAPDSSVVSISGITLTKGLPQSFLGGGAILVIGGKTNINSCIITGNDASYTYYGEGGGIANEGGTLTINNSSVINNLAYYDGGGIAAEYGPTVITNSTISNNNSYQLDSTDASSGGWGGGIYTADQLTLTNCTVFGNIAQDGSNIYSNYFDSLNVSTTGLGNTIVAGGINATGFAGIGPDLFGTNFVSSGYNLIQDKSAGAYTFINGLGTGDLTGSGPGLLSLGNYGGPTPTLLPLPNSPVINKGNPSLTSAQFDQRGYTRVAGGHADIGAVEANYQSSTFAGTPQSAAINTLFATTPQGRLTESGNPVYGVKVFFKSPATGASGTFANSKLLDTASTNISGIATATAFTANGTTGSYTVIDSIGAAFANAGFALKNTNALAVSFGHITATINNCTVQITWQTLTGQAGETFTLEHSTDGIDFTPLYAVTGQTNSIAAQNYNYTHLSPAVGANYYRIKETDADGLITYSSTAIVVNTCTNAPVIAYPNPAHSTLTLVMPGTAKQAISIFDAQGRLVTRYASVIGTLNINVSRWAAGVYTLSVTKDDKTTYELKIIKN